MEYYSRFRGTAITEIKDGLVTIPRDASRFFEPLEEYIVFRAQSGGYKHLSIAKAKEFDSKSFGLEKDEARFINDLVTRSAQNQVIAIKIPELSLKYLELRYVEHDSIRLIGNEEAVQVQIVGFNSGILDVWHPKDFKNYERDKKPRMTEDLDKLAKAGI